MCCFSGKVDYVKSTKIFVRATDKGDEQYVAYSMQVGLPSDVAMILPIPVKPKTGDDAVKFINLEGYPKFFRDLERGFPQPPQAKSKYPSRGAVDSKVIKVVSVGSFEASFVPTVNDFDRLDERFRLPDGTWDKLPAYANYGFAVFKFKEGRHDVHPMAFKFPGSTSKLFFPTVHIHDGQVHARAKFDHVLYCQLGDHDLPALNRWKESPGHPDSFMQIDKTKKIVEPGSHVYRKALRGTLKNVDTFV